MKFSKLILGLVSVASLAHAESHAFEQRLPVPNLADLAAETLRGSVHPELQRFRDTVGRLFSPNTTLPASVSVPSTDDDASVRVWLVKEIFQLAIHMDKDPQYETFDIFCSYWFGNFCKSISLTSGQVESALDFVLDFVGIVLAQQNDDAEKLTKDYDALRFAIDAYIVKLDQLCEVIANEPEKIEATVGDFISCLPPIFQVIADAAEKFVLTLGVIAKKQVNIDFNWVKKWAAAIKNTAIAAGDLLVSLLQNYLGTVAASGESDQSTVADALATFEGHLAEVCTEIVELTKNFRTVEVETLGSEYKGAVKAFTTPRPDGGVTLFVVDEPKSSFKLWLGISITLAALVLVLLISFVACRKSSINASAIDDQTVVMV